MSHDQEILDKLQNFTDKFKNALKTQGLVIPVKCAQGYKLDDFLIKRKPEGYAIIHSPSRTAIHEHINLLQTAVIIANSLATKKPVNDTTLLMDDWNAASKKFDIVLFQKRISSAKQKKDGFNIDLYSIRLQESQIQFKQHMKSINDNYRRLTRLLYQNPNK
jgi:hypothetical protein